MAEPLETAFQKLTGRAPTDADRERLYRVKDALRLPNNDALWSLLIALDYHQSLYEQIPSRIEKLLEQVSIPTWWVWLLGGRTRFVRGYKQVIFAVLVVASLLIAAALGRNLGYAAAQQDLMDRYDLAAARWANSPEGRHARFLADNGTLAWADSREGIMARRLIAAAPPDALTAGADLAVVRRTDARWLESEAGKHARTLSDDGTLVWGEWLRALVHNRLIAEVGNTPESPRCEGVSTMGFAWREHGKSKSWHSCDVWHGSIRIDMD